VESIYLLFGEQALVTGGLDSRDPAPVVDGASGARRVLLVCFGCIVGALAVLFLVFITLVSIGARPNLPTLRSDLGRVHLPAQYRLTTTGTGCHNGCSVIQTWTWLPAGGRTASDQCRDASRALGSAFPDAAPDLPLSSLPSRPVCAYLASNSTVFHGKTFIEAIVTRRSSGSASGFVIQLSAYD
jgi:hypothetical protein